MLGGNEHTCLLKGVRNDTQQTANIALHFPVASEGSARLAQSKHNINPSLELVAFTLAMRFDLVFRRLHLQKTKHRLVITVVAFLLQAVCHQFETGMGLVSFGLDP